MCFFLLLLVWWAPFYLFGAPDTRRGPTFFFFSFCTSICAFSPSCMGRRGRAFCVLPYVLITFICIAFYGWCFAFAPLFSCLVRSCIHRLPACLASCIARLRPRRPSARRMRLYSISNYAQRFLLFVSKYTHTCFLLTYLSPRTLCRNLLEIKIKIRN